MRSWIRVGIATLLVTLALRAPAAIISQGAGLGVTADWAGVGEVGNTAGFYGTGTLIDSRHVLTVAHLVDGLTQTQGRFLVGGQTYTSTVIAIHPLYDGSNQYDLAVITLDRDATGVSTYAINTGSVNELTAGNGIKVGFGYGGDGANGTTAANKALYPYGTKRAGQQAIDLISTTTLNLTDGWNHTITVEPGLLGYDFDNHQLGTSGPLGGAAVGPDEIDTTDGDSGGPMFQWDAAHGQYVITGITVDGSDPLSRFGDISLDVRVADNAAWIAAQVPEPGAVGVMGAAAMLFALRRPRVGAHP